MRIWTYVSVAIALAAAPVISRAQLMIPDSGTGDRVMLFNAFDGSLIDADWITDVGQPYVFTTPKEAAVVGNQIWVSDQWLTRCTASTCRATTSAASRPTRRATRWITSAGLATTGATCT